MTIDAKTVAELAAKGTQGEWEAIRNTAFWEINPKNRRDEDPYTIGDVCATAPGNPDGGDQEANAQRIANVPAMKP